MRRIWISIIFLFLFMTLHQADKYLISPLTSLIMKEFNISHTEMGAVFTLAIIVSAVFFIVWGYLYDRYSRRLLITVAGLIWGVTTWFSAIVRTFQQFMVARSFTGVDDASDSGIYSLVSDYIPPKSRGRIIGLLSTSAAIGTIFGTIAGYYIGYNMGWRTAFIITGALGIVIAILVYLIVMETPRGSAEPELAGLLREDIYKFNKDVALNLLKRRSMFLLGLQGFFGVFPWQVITFWFFKYLVDERKFTPETATFTMILLLIFLTFGNILGGVIGDYLFKKYIRGRIVFSTIIAYLSALSIYLILIIPFSEVNLFIAGSAITALIIPMAGPNVSATVFDIAEPEVKTTARGILRIFENSGSALAPFMAGILADMYSLHYAIALICTVTWTLCGIFFTILSIVVKDDILRLRRKMAERAEELKKRVK